MLHLLALWRIRFVKTMLWSLLSSCHTILVTQVFCVAACFQRQGVHKRAHHLHCRPGLHSPYSFLKPLCSFEPTLEISVIFLFPPLSLLPNQFANSCPRCVAFTLRGGPFVCISLHLSTLLRHHIAHFDFLTLSLTGLPAYCIFPFLFPSFFIYILLHSSVTFLWLLC